MLKPAIADASLTKPILPATAPETMQELQRTHARMLAALNHEIRTPLTGILGMADLLLESELSAEQREFVQATRGCAENLLESVSNALEYAAITAGHLRLSEAAFHLQEVIRTSVSTMHSRAAARGIQIELFVDPGETTAPEIVIGDAVRLRQVLGILLGHAIKACTQEEISVAVSTFCMTAERRLTLTVSVGDNGPDLTSERIQSLFLPAEPGGYTQASLELGLPLAFQLVRAMGGILEAEAIPGSGLLLTITLPLRVPESSTESGIRPGPASPARPHILLVEDNEVAQRFMSTVLERKGYQVFVAASGAAAIEAVRVNGFDLILMDVQMPDMDGMEATRRIRLLPRGLVLPIIACTANTSYEVRNACSDSGMDDFLPKPVQTSELVEVINRNLVRHGKP